MSEVYDMTNSYSDDVPLNEKNYHELRCIRCVLERILQHFDSSLFIDYEMEKFGKSYRQKL